MRSDAAAPVAVVGGGFAGTMTAVQLARRGVSVRLFDAGARFARGVAYATLDPVHLLNVPAAKMSAWPDAPGDFADWLGIAPGAFARRRDYGAYVEEILAAHPMVLVDPRRVVSATRNGEGWLLALEDGPTVAAQALVLALGNAPPAALSERDGAALVEDPWSDRGRAALEEAAKGDGEILLVGTGLTAVDMVLSLDALGFAGRVVAVSRRGLLPRVHAPHDAAPVERDALPQGNVRGLARWLRQRSAAVGFRAAVDSLRPHSAALWQGWDEAERRRFLRHARPWWDVHRHRIAPEVGSRLEDMRADGRLDVIAGRIAEDVDGAKVRLRGGGERSLRPALIVNCTGPSADVTRSSDPLLRGLLEAGAVVPAPLGIGLLTDAADRAGHHLWAVGALTKGMYWEITAVPDIRGQAERVAAAVQKELDAHG